MRLLGWSKVNLGPRESRQVAVVADPRLLADFDPERNLWAIAAGSYEAALGSASDSLADRASTQIESATLKP